MPIVLRTTLKNWDGEEETRNQTQEGTYKWEMACTQAAMITTSEGSLVSGDSLGMTEAMYICTLQPLCLACLNRIGWCAVAWIPLILLIHLMHLKLWRRDCCYLLLVIPSLNLRQRKSSILHPKPLMCVLCDLCLHSIAQTTFLLYRIALHYILSLWYVAYTQYFGFV